jgi:hypothetical protein
MGAEASVYWLCGLGAVSGLLIKLLYQLHASGII